MLSRLGQLVHHILTGTEKMCGTKSMKLKTTRFELKPVPFINMGAIDIDRQKYILFILDT